MVLCSVVTVGITACNKEKAPTPDELNRNITAYTNNLDEDGKFLILRTVKLRIKKIKSQLQTKNRIIRREKQGKAQRLKEHQEVALQKKKRKIRKKGRVQKILLLKKRPRKKFLTQSARKPKHTLMISAFRQLRRNM